MGAQRSRAGTCPLNSRHNRSRYTPPARVHRARIRRARIPREGSRTGWIQGAAGRPEASSALIEQIELRLRITIDDGEVSCDNAAEISECHRRAPFVVGGLLKAPRDRHRRRESPRRAASVHKIHRLSMPGTFNMHDLCIKNAPITWIGALTENVLQSAGIRPLRPPSRPSCRRPGRARRARAWRLSAASGGEASRARVCRKRRSGARGRCLRRRC